MLSNNIRDSIHQYYPRFLSHCSDEYDGWDQIKINGMVINNVVARHIEESDKIMDFIFRISEEQLRDSEWVNLYITVIDSLISQSNICLTWIYILNVIREKITEFDKWSITEITHGRNSRRVNDMIERGGFPVNIQEKNKALYLCKMPKPNDQRVHQYIMRKWHDEPFRNNEILTYLAKHIVMDESNTQLDLLPDSMIHEDFIIVHKCLVMLNFSDSNYSDTKMQRHDKYITWDHNGHRIKCDINNQFNKFVVNDTIDMHIESIN